MDGCNDCVFINNLNSDDKGIYFTETDNFIAYISQEQISDFHLIIQPKKHISRMTEFEPDEWKEFGELSRKISGSSFYYANSHLLAVNGMLEPKQDHFKFQIITSVPKQMEIPWEPKSISEHQRGIDEYFIRETVSHFPENRSPIRIYPDQPVYEKFKFEDIKPGIGCVYHGKIMANERHSCEFSPRKDAIPAIDDPEFKPANEVHFMHEGDLLGLVEINGQKRAYSLRVLVAHEVVNDTLGGVPISVSYCPLCESVTVFERTIDGELNSFGVSGYLLNSDVLMFDRNTESLWSQIEGKCIYGKFLGRDLQFLPFQIIEWQDLLTNFPDIEVLTDNTGFYRDYQREAYQEYRSNDSIFFPVAKKDSSQQLPVKEVIYAVELGGVPKAYPEKIIKEKRIIIDEVNGEKILIISGSDGCIRSFSGSIPSSLTVENGSFKDDTGNIWNDYGEANNGIKLNPRNDFIRMFYFAWVAFNPSSDIEVYS